MIIDVPQINQLPALRYLWKEAFGDTDDFLDSFQSTAFDPNRCRCVTLDKNTVAALYWFDCSLEGKPIAYLYAIATANAYRGRGICHALMENTHSHLRVLGYEGCVLVPSSKELFDFYGRLGYDVSCHVSEFQCSASQESVAVRRVSKTEYAELRHSLLPLGGVVQENENIDFLQTMADLYAGDGFALAAAHRNGVLYGIELLGDKDVAPAILRALGCNKGRFRTVGNDKPFAMYRSLTDGKLTPSYFGLAFD